MHGGLAFDGQISWPRGFDYHVVNVRYYRTASEPGNKFVGGMRD